MHFTNRDLKYFQLAKREAEKSKFKPFRLGAVIVYKNIVIGSGHNSQQKTHPLQKRYNKQYRNFKHDGGKMISDTLHAEISALVDISYVQGMQIKNWNDVSIYVYRITPGLEHGYGCAKPCPACINCLRDYGIRHVYYTDYAGFNYMYLA